MTRLFVALSLPESVRRRLEGLRGGLPGAHWQSAEQMHLTLRFIGEVDGAAFAEIGDALARVEADSFSLTLDGVGHFPTRGRVRILWAGVAPNPALAHLRARIEAAVTGLGFAPEGRNYSPHVTLARFASRVPAQRLQDFVSYHGLYTSGPFAVRSFELFRAISVRAAPTTRSRRAIPWRRRPRSGPTGATAPARRRRVSQASGASARRLRERKRLLAPGA